MCALEECAFCPCCMKQSIDVLYIQLTDDVDEFSLSLLIFCLLNLSVSDREVLKSPTIIISLYISAFSFSSFASHTLTLWTVNVPHASQSPYLPFSWDRMTRHLELSVSLPPGRLDSAKIPAG